MAYTFGMNPTNGKCIFLEFANMLFKSGEYEIDFKVSQMFLKFYNHFYATV